MFSLKLEKWSFHVVDLPRTGKKCTEIIKVIGQIQDEMQHPSFSFAKGFIEMSDGQFIQSATANSMFCYDVY